MTRRIHSIVLMAVFSVLMLTALGLFTKPVHAEVSEEQPDGEFNFSIVWGENHQGMRSTQYTATSLIPITVVTQISDPHSDTVSVISQTVDSVGISNTFEYSRVDHITLKPHHELAPFIVTYRENDCSNKASFELDTRYGWGDIFVTSSVDALLVLKHSYGVPFETQIYRNSRLQFTADFIGSITLYNDTAGSEVCAVIWWNMLRVDDIPVVVNNDVFTVTEGTTTRLFPLANDENLEDVGFTFEDDHLPFQTETGPWGMWTVISPTTGTYTVTYAVHPSNGPSKFGEIVLNVLPSNQPPVPPADNMVLVDDTFKMLEGTTATFYPLDNDEGIGQLAGGMVSSDGLPFETKVGAWGSWTVISPTAGIYTTTYTVSPQNGPAQTANIFLHVVPRPPTVILVTDVFTATEGDDLSLFPAYNDIGYTMRDIESFVVTHATPLNVATVVPGEIQVMGAIAGKFLINYYMVVYGRSFSGYVTLIVSPKATIENPTAEEPTQQPNEKFQLLLAAIHNQ